MTADTSLETPKRTLEGVVSRFVKGLGGRLEAINQAHAAQNWEELLMLSHKLAGAALFGFPDLGGAAHNLEMAVKSGKTKELQELINAVAQQCDFCLKRTPL